MDDAELWVRISQDDAEAFAVLFRLHGRALYNVLFRAVGSWSIAEDLLSVVFLEAWRRRNVVVVDGQVLPFLCGITINVARNHRRSLRRYEAALSRVPSPSTPPPEDDDTNGRIDDERRYAFALSLLRRLPRREREVFLLCAWSDCSYKDAAAALGVPIGTVRSRLSRARRRLDALTANEDLAHPPYLHKEPT